MKKLLVIVFVASFALGFTLTEGEHTQPAHSECPYMNKIYKASSADELTCPYLKGLLNNQSSGGTGCPYLESNEEKSACPYTDETEGSPAQQSVPQPQVNNDYRSV